MMSKKKDELTRINWLIIFISIGLIIALIILLKVSF